MDDNFVKNAVFEDIVLLSQCVQIILIKLQTLSTGPTQYVRILLRELEYILH